MSSIMPQPLVRATLAVVAALFALEVLSALPGLFSEQASMQIRVVAGMVVIVLCTALCVARPIADPRERLAWACLAGFLVCNSLGAAYFATALAELPERPVPSWSDVFWFLRYPFLLVGVHLLVRSRTPGFGAAQWADGAVGAFSLLAVTGIFVIEPVLNHVSDPLERLIWIVYPVADVAALGFVVGIVALIGRRMSRMGALVAALAIFAITDGLYTRVLVQTGESPLAGIYDAGYLSTAALLALAAWQRPPRSYEQPDPHSASAALPLGFAVLGLVLLAFDDVRSLNGFVSIGAALALGGVLVRQALFARDNRRILLRVREEAVTDALTGLPNRRSLLEQLECRLAEDDEPFAVALMDLNGFKDYNDAFGHHAGDGLLARLGAKLELTVGQAGTAFRLGGDEFCVLVEPGHQASDIAARAASALAEEGSGFRITASYGLVHVPEEAADAAEVLRLADRRMYAQKGESRRARQREEAMDVLTTLQRERYPDLDDHTLGVTAWAERVAEKLGVRVSERQEIRLGAMLHDVGKMAIPDSIIQKPGPLSEREWELVRRHPVIGARIIESAPALAHASVVARCHHERWDGSGYPEGLAGEQIPLSARIISVCDAFQAMIADRPYRKGRPVTEAFDELRRCAGTQFDPTVVEAFIEVLLEPGLVGLSEPLTLTPAALPAPNGDLADARSAPGRPAA